MAEAFKVTGQSQTVQVLSSGQVIDVMAVNFSTKPHHATAQVLVPIAAWEAGKTATYAEPVAVEIEKLIGAGLATSGSFVQDVDPQSGLLTGYVEFVVSYTGTDSLAASTVRVKVPVRELDGKSDKTPEVALKRAKAALEHTAGL